MKRINYEKQEAWCSPSSNYSYWNLRSEEIWRVAKKPNFADEGDRKSEDFQDEDPHTQDGRRHDYDFNGSRNLKERIALYVGGINPRGEKLCLLSVSRNDAVLFPNATRMEDLPKKIAG